MNGNFKCDIVGKFSPWLIKFKTKVEIWQS